MNGIPKSGRELEGAIAPSLQFKWRALELTGACIAVFLLSQVFPEFFYSNFVLDRAALLSRPWTLLTSMFMHADFPHLYFNMFALAVFGTLFEKQAGSRNFLVVFFAGGVLAGLAGLTFYESLLGASGAIFSTLACFAIFRPKAIVWVLGVPMYVLGALFVWIGLDLLGFFSPDGIAHASHLAGMAFGIGYGFWLRRRHPEPKTEKGKPALTEKEMEDWEKSWMNK